MANPVDLNAELAQFKEQLTDKILQQIEGDIWKIAK